MYIIYDKYAIFQTSQEFGGGEEKAPTEGLMV
jgi:hypothetical protein